mmetsp:Transcript_51845/g.110870  ORF Transcript_51845/g.110870 Transcript_51845/m.110870 type:complete len:382 (+) Transcript_51845:53-1198(+)
MQSLGEPVPLPPRAACQTAAASESLEAFFERYLRVLLQLVTDANPKECGGAWRAQLHPQFSCVGPTGAAMCADEVLGEAVLSEWRLGLMYRHYGSPLMAELSIQPFGEGCAICRATLVRRYTSRCCQDFDRHVLRLQVTAVPGEDGRLRVTRHWYEPVPPAQIAGMQCHSQISQDLWVLNRLGACKPGAGFFLEVGANHPEELSNSYILEKAAKWRGICVEPFPVGDWSTRSAHLVRAAVGPDGGRLKFVAPGSVLGGLVEQVDLPRVLRDVPPDQQQVVEVQTCTIATILRAVWPQDAQATPEAPRVVHYLSLDTEGSEYDILCSFPFDQWILLSITVEHNFREPTRTQIRQLLESRGFMLDVSVEHDDFFLLSGYERYL